MSRGGARLGAGRKPVEPALKKEPIYIKLPKWLLEWMDAQEESRPNLIEDAMRQHYDIRPPGEK
jgi:hypothetical protein